MKILVKLRRIPLVVVCFFIDRFFSKELILFRIIFSEISNATLKYLAEIDENFIPPHIPNPNAIKDAISIINPFLNPL